jgi:hypothetical protein
MGAIGSVHAPGTTPTDPDEVAGLIPTHITLQNLTNRSATRAAYISALQAADAKDIRPLLAFVRS